MKIYAGALILLFLVFVALVFFIGPWLGEVYQNVLQPNAEDCRNIPSGAACL